MCTARMPSESVTCFEPVSFRSNRVGWRGIRFRYFFPSSYCAIRVSCLSQSMDDKNEALKDLGLFSLRKKIQDTVVRAEMMAATALKLEEARQIKQEEMFRKFNLWDDIAKSNEFLVALADAAKVVDGLKDLKYKAEEAKLITQLAEMDVIDQQLLKQAHKSSMDVSSFLDRYEISKLLSGPYDMQGACIIIRDVPEGSNSELWKESILSMYMRWAEKQGCKGRMTEKHTLKDGRIKSITIEFESKYAFGYLFGERGLHRMVKNSFDGSVVQESKLAFVDVIPLFLESAPELHIDDEELEVASISQCEENQLGYVAADAVRICHIPTGLQFQCSGERNSFSNKMKALNRLKAKLLLVAAEQGESCIKHINRKFIADEAEQEVRMYVFNPDKFVQDVKTGIQLPDPTSVLDGNLELLIRAHINARNSKKKPESFER